jgi:hypothetical protein
MPVNACGTEPNASFDPNASFEPEAGPPHDEPICHTESNVPTLASAASEPFVLQHRTVTSTPDGQVETRAALLHGHDPETGLDVEVFSVAARSGPSAHGIEAVVERFGFSSERGKVSVDLLSAAAEVGTHNADGSKGFNIGASAVAAAAEGTLKWNGTDQATLGVAAGVGFQLSVGTRDADHDGKREACIRVVEILTLGLCMELPE